MPKVITAVKSSRGRDVRCGKCGVAIEVGITYRHFQKYKAPKQYRCMKIECSPKQSDLTGSDKLARLYLCQEGLEHDVQVFLEEKTMDGDALNILADAVDAQVEEVRSVGEEYQESADNMDEYFPGSSKVEEIQEKADGCEAFADALENATSEIRDMEQDDDEDDETFIERVAESVIGAIDELAIN